MESSEIYFNSAWESTCHSVKISAMKFRIEIK
jgi:hypothetical protein